MTNKKEWTRKLAFVTIYLTEVDEEIHAIVDCKSAGCFELTKTYSENLSQFEQRIVQMAYQRLLSDATRFKTEAEKQAFIIKDKDGWYPIANLDLKENCGIPYLVFSKDLIDEDFNPSGVAEGTYLDGDKPGWFGGVWNANTDSYDLVPINPTHYKEKLGPNV